MANIVTQHGNIRIITQVVPQAGSLSTQTDAVRVADSTSGASKFIPTQNKNIKNTLLKVIGIIQIVWGATQVSFGTAMTIFQRSFTITVQSGVHFWIGILLLISGSFLVEIEKRRLVWLVLSYGLNSVFIIVLLLEVSLAITALIRFRSQNQQDYQQMVS
ncbi:uncharacterized protein LOC134487386 isoform X2 [Candoia aspera]|uniref:uncharacterized protein LOC134487386 isoform X2 n=1 Tax=Candoia aspera TaxID=51853 RepID=UPI002FD8114B